MHYQDFFSLHRLYPEISFQRVLSLQTQVLSLTYSMSQLCNHFLLMLLLSVIEASRAAVSTVAAVLASGADWIASNAAFFMASDDLVAVDTVSQLLIVSSVAD